MREILENKIYVVLSVKHRQDFNNKINILLYYNVINVIGFIV